MSSSTYISLEQSDLTWAAEQGLLSTSEVAALWPALVKRTAGRGGLNVALVSFYAGALLITGALTWFLNLVWASSALLFFLSLAYVVLFGAAGVKLWFDGPSQFGVPQLVGGLFVTVAVAVSPVVTFAVERYFNVTVHNHPLLLIELTPVVTGVLALSVVHFPFLTAPISAGLFSAATLDLPILFYNDPSLTTECLFAFVFGLGMNTVAFFTDRQKFKQDFAFWLYLFGGLCSFISITTLFFVDSHILGPYQVGYGIFSAIYLIVAGLINRQSLVVFGAIGEAFYLLWLTNDLFYDSWAYPFALTAVGLLIIYMGVQLQKYFSNNAAKAAEATEEVAPSPFVSGPAYVPAHYMPLPVHAPQLPPMQPHFFMPAAVPVVPASKHDLQAERFV